MPLQSMYLKPAGETVQFQFLLALPPPPPELSVGGGPGNEADPVRIDAPAKPVKVEEEEGKAMEREVVKAKEGGRWVGKEKEEEEEEEGGRGRRRGRREGGGEERRR